MNSTLLMLSAFALGAATISVPVHADNAMNGMDMSGTKAAPKPAAAPTSVTKLLSVTATISPAAPQTGDNMLDLTISDAFGKPMTGLKLTTSVAMTSMDMGTTHPAFTETGGGHYTAKVNFGMDGPWRVVVRNQGGKVAVLDFNAGSKTPWKSPQIKTAVIKAASIAPTQPAAPAAMPGMEMSGAAAPPADQPASSTADTRTPDTSTPDMAGMNMKGMAVLKTATVPELKETGTYIATGDENWKMQTGFGHNAPMVGMMNQMMIGGSGMEGMKMAPMTMKFGEENYAKPGASDTDDSMAGMDMGGKTAAASKPGDPSKSGDMAGMKMDAPAAGSAAPAASAPVKITAETASTPKAGDNPLTISLTDAQGKPVTGAKISTSVAMTSMDMGTTHPTVTEKGAGQYTATVNFSMAGPWQVKVKVIPPGQKPQTKAFDFTAQ